MRHVAHVAHDAHCEYQFEWRGGWEMRQMLALSPKPRAEPVKNNNPAAPGIACRSGTMAEYGHADFEEDDGAHLEALGCAHSSPLSVPRKTPRY